jgi:alpha-L-fucosidase
MGEWLEKNGDSVYGTRGGPVPPQPWGVTTAKDAAVYVHVLTLPEADAEGWRTLTGTEKLPLVSMNYLGTDTEVEYRRDAAGNLQVKLVDIGEDPMDVVLVARQGI